MYMNNSYLSLLIFIIVTAVYFIVLKKPILTFDILQNDADYLSYQKGMYSKLIIYFFLVVLTQFGVNVGAILSTCGGNVGQSVGAAALITFIPWIFVFGVIIIVLVAFPGWKAAFSNVVGYFVVSRQANNILTDLLVVTEVNGDIEKAAGGDLQKKDALQEAASAIIKLTGNMSLLINQIVPDNFKTYWNILIPLMKQDLPPEKISELQQRLLNIVVLRDNIGEAMWYVYTAILLTSIVQYKIATQGCQPDLATLNANQAVFQKQQKETQEANEASTSTVYAL